MVARATRVELHDRVQQDALALDATTGVVVTEVIQATEDPG
jgi:hypothetical protein